MPLVLFVKLEIVLFNFAQLKIFSKMILYEIVKRAVLGYLDMGGKKLI